MPQERNDMLLPEPWSCRDCVHFKRCEWLIGIKGDETMCDWAPHRFKLDTIGTLCRLVKDAGLVMTLYGEPVSEDELRTFTTASVVNRLTKAAAGQ